MSAAIQPVPHAASPEAGMRADEAAPQSSGSDRRGGRPEGHNFAGNDRRAASSSKAYEILERTFAACSLIGAVGTTGGAILAVNGFGPFALLGATSLVILVSACLGRFAQEAVIKFQRGELARVYASALQGPRRTVFERRAGPTRMEAISQSLLGILESIRLKVLNGDHVRLWALAMRRALDTRAETTKALAATLGEDAHAIAAAAAAARRAQAEMTSEVGALFEHAGRAAESTTHMAEEADGLAMSVRVVAAQLRKSAVLAADLANNAVSAQRDAASVTEVTAGLIETASQLRAVLERAQAAGQMAEQEAQPGSSDVVAEIRSLSAAGQQALETMVQAARRLRADADTMAITVSVMNDTVQAQGALGQALSDSASYQSEGVSRLLKRAESARGEIISLQQRAGSIERREMGLGADPAARRAVERLPDHAEAIAKILRDLPVFESKLPETKPV